MVLSISAVWHSTEYIKYFSSWLGGHETATQEEWIQLKAATSNSEHC